MNPVERAVRGGRAKVLTKQTSNGDYICAACGKDTHITIDCHTLESLVVS